MPQFHDPDVGLGEQRCAACHQPTNVSHIVQLPDKRQVCLWCEADMHAEGSVRLDDAPLPSDSDAVAAELLGDDDADVKAAVFGTTEPRPCCANWAVPTGDGWICDVCKRTWRQMESEKKEPPLTSREQWYLDAEENDPDCDPHYTCNDCMAEFIARQTGE